MSGIDEGIPFCPRCMDEYKIIEHPSYWRTIHLTGNIWLVSDRFVKMSQQYAGYNVIFSGSFDSVCASEFSSIRGFECSWTTLDKETFTDGKFMRVHVYKRESPMYDIVMSRLKYYYEKSGGCFVK